MIVDQDNVQEALSKIRACKILALDTETTGLLPHKNDDLFSVIISTVEDNFYFNFQDYNNVKPLDKSLFTSFAEIFSDQSNTVYMQNAKFDMHFLAKHGVFVTCRIIDLKFLDRIHNNQHLSYSLDEISKRWGSIKLDTVKNYVVENKLKETIEYPEYNKTEEKHHYELVPFDIISKYGEQDGGATLEVGRKILFNIIEEDKNSEGKNTQMAVVENEMQLVHTLFNMEHVGIKIDRKYCEEAAHHYKTSCSKAETDFKNITGVDFIKGTTVFEEVFISEKDKWAMTEKKNWKWDKKVLSKFTNPAAGAAAEYAESKKQLEYFQNFLWFADKNDVIHPGFDQAGTVTGRLSAHSPNMQNMTNPDKYEDDSEGSKYPVRASFIPRQGYFYALIDYKQIEYRVFLDIAREQNLIGLVLSGLDVHEATTKIAPVTRKEAKTVNFLTLYGGGAAKLAGMLYETTVSAEALQAIYMMHVLNWRVTPEHIAICSKLTAEEIEVNKALINKAVAIQKTIFNAAPAIKDTTKAIQKAAENRGYIFNWLGRRYQFAKKETCYKAPNHLIQGNCADILKVAMNRVNAYLKDKKSRMVLTIHDELVIEVFFGEEFVIEEIKKIMETVYPFKHLPLEVDVEYSLTNLADKKSWVGHHV